MLEYPMSFNGLTMQDQSKRDLADLTPVIPRAVHRREPCLPCLEKQGFRVRDREQRRELGRLLGGPGAYSGPVVADSSTGVAHYEAAGLTVVAPGRFFNNGRPGDGLPGSVTAQNISPYGSGGPLALLDHQQAANYQAALDSTVAISAADLGLETGHGYYVIVAYTLAIDPSKTPRIGWHNTTSGDAPGNVNTAEALAVDPTSVQTGGLHLFGTGSAGDSAITLWPTSSDQMWIRAFAVTAMAVGEYIAVDQIYLLDNRGARCFLFFAGQQGPFPNPRSTELKYVTDTLAYGLEGTGSLTPADVWEDGQITDTPAVSETDLQSGYSRLLSRAVGSPAAGDRILTRSQLLVSCRSNDTAEILTRGRYGKIDLDVAAGGRQNQVANVPHNWHLRFLPTSFLYDNDTFVATENVDLYQYAPAGSDTGTVVRTELIGIARPPLNPPDAITGGCDTVQGPGQADIDNLVHWNFQVSYEQLIDVDIEYRVPEFPSIAGDWQPASYLGTGLWETGDIALDATLDQGTYTIEFRAVYFDSFTDTSVAPSDPITCQFTVGAGDPPYPVYITNCPTSPIFSTTQPVEFAAPVVAGFTEPDHYTYTLDGGAEVTVTTSPFTLTGLAAGTHTVCVESWDAAGNHSAQACCQFVVEAPPGGPVAAPASGCGASDLAWGALNGSGWWVKVLSVDGLWDADVRDERYPRPGRSGERSFDDFYGGKSITITAEVRARNIARLREGQRAVQRAFSDLQSHRFYFRSWIDAQLLYVCARKIQPIVMAEAQPDEAYRRGFVVTIRGDDPRAYSVAQTCIDLGVGVGGTGQAGTGHWRTYFIQTEELAGGNPLRMRSYNIPATRNLRDYPSSGLIGGGGGAVTTTAVNLGTAETYPVTKIYGPMAGPISLVNVRTGEQIVWNADMIIPSGQFLQIDHGFGEITRNGVLPLDFTGLDATQTQFWPLEPGSQDVALLAFSSGDGAHATLCWNNAFR